jgi:molybdenum cofactor biosynthesis enzyme MoaA
LKTYWSGHLYCIDEIFDKKSAIVLFPEIPSWFVIDKSMVKVFKAFLESQSESEFIDKTMRQQSTRSSLKLSDVYRPMRHLVEKYTTREKPVSFGSLSNAVVNISRCCNLACNYCFNRAPAAVATAKDFISLRLAETVFENLRNLCEPDKLRVHLSGGEPFLHPELCQLVARAKHHGFFVTIVTNGTFLTPTVSTELLESGLDELRISVDGPTAEAHNRNRGNTFAKIIAGIKAIKAAGFSKRVVLSATIATNNVSDMHAFPYFAARLGCSYNFSYLKPTGRAEHASVCYDSITAQLRMMRRRTRPQTRHLKRTSCGIGSTRFCTSESRLSFQAISQRLNGQYSIFPSVAPSICVLE